MKVLMSADTVGGVWYYALELARALGAEVALATMGAPLKPEQRREVAKIPNLEVYESDYRLEWMEDPWEDVKATGAWLLALEKKLKPDVVHLNSFAHGAIDWSRPVLVVGHSCVLSWWEAVKGEAAPQSWDRYRLEVARGLHSADLVIAPTKAMLKTLMRHYGPLPASQVIPNGRDASRLAPAKKEPFILSAGRLWDEAKNVTLLARAAPELSWPVYVAGEEKHPVGGAVSLEHLCFLGRLPYERLAGWYARASIYALPARYEPFGLSALEAALAGCALVLGDIPSLREVWGEAALYVSPEDPKMLTMTLDALIAEAPWRQALAASARSRALAFTPERFAKGYLDAYREVIRSRECA